MLAHPMRRAFLRLGFLVTAGGLAACDNAPTAPPGGMAAVDLVPSAIVLTPGLSVFTDRASWEAAVAGAGGTVVNMDFAGLTLGRVTQLVTDYGDFGIVVDHVSASEFSNPGISIFPDASCSLGVGDCDVFTFNMKDATSALDMPVYNRLGFLQDIIAFGGDFIQLGVTAPPPGSATGVVTVRIGSESVAINQYLDENGNGFFGLVASAADAVEFTFVKSASLQNDIFQVYNPAYSIAPAGGDPDAQEQIDDLRAVIAGLGYAGGITASLDSKLRTATSALLAGNTAAACTALRDLINHSSALRGKKISVAHANAIIAAAEGIIAELGCS